MSQPNYEPASIDEDRLKHDWEYRWEHGKQVIGFDDTDWETIRETAPHLRPHLRDIVERLYQRFMEYEPTAKFYLHEDGSFNEEDYEHRVHGFVLWLERIFDWPENEKYVKYLKDVGEIHTKELGFDHMIVHPFYMGPTFSILFDEIMTILGDELEDGQRLARASISWQKFFQLQEDLMRRAYAKGD